MLVKYDDKKTRIIATGVDYTVSAIYNTLTFPRFLIKKRRCFDKILIIALSSVTNAVRTMPTIDISKKYFPRSDIDILTTTENESLFRHNKNINDIMTINPSWSKKDSFSQFISEYKSNIIKLYKNRYDLALDMDFDFKNIFFFMYLPRAKRRIGYGISGLGYLLNDNVKYNQYLPAVIRKLELLKPLNVPVDNPKLNKNPKIELDAKTKSKAKDFIKNNYKIKKNDKYIIFTFNKTTEEIAKYINSFLGKNNKIKIFVQKNNINQEELQEKIIKKNKEKVFIINNNTLGENICGFIENSSLIVGNDHPYQHIAAALGSKTLTIEENDDYSRFKPFGKPKLNKVIKSYKTLNKSINSMLKK